MKQTFPKIEKKPELSANGYTGRTERDISETITYGTYEESLASFDKILKKGIRTDELIEKTQDESAVIKAFNRGAKLVGWTNVQGIDRGQLRLF